MKKITFNPGRAVVIVLAFALVGLLTGCDTVESLGKEADAYLAKGDRKSAAIQFQALLAKDPKNAHANVELGRIMAEVGRLNDAEAFLKRALELGKPLPEIASVLGRTLVDLEKYDELLELLEPKPGQPQPSDAQVLAEYAILRGLAYMGKRDLTSANTQFQLAMSALPGKAKLGLARVALARHERERAAELVDALIEADPRDIEARLARAELQRTAGKLDQALREYDEIAKLAPGNLTAAFTRVITLASAGRIPEARPPLAQIEKTAPAGPIAQFAHALIDCREQRYRSCGDQLDRVFAMRPGYLPALLLSGQRNFAVGNLASAEKDFIAYLDRLPGDVRARKLLAATMLARLQPVAALQILRPMMESEREDPQLLGIAGQALLQLGDVRRSREMLEKAVKLAPKDAEFRAALALTHLASGMRRRAETEFRSAIALEPPNTKADYGLIMLLLNEGRTEPAREVAAALAKRLPGDPQSHMLGGIVAEQAGDLPGARSAFQRALEVEPRFFEAVRGLARLDLAEGKADAARKRVQAVLDKNATDLTAMLAMSELELRTGRRAEGLAWARRAVNAHPGATEALIMASRALADSGELDEAIVTAQQALEAHPRNPDTLKLLGKLYTDKKDHQSAITVYTSLVGAQPTSMQAAMLLISAYMASGDTTTALAAARGALQRNPRSVEARVLFAEALLRARKYSEAIEFSKKLQKENPKAGLGYWLEGQALQARGDVQLALKPFEAAARLNPSRQTLISAHKAASLVKPGSEQDKPLRDWLEKNPEDDEMRLYLADAWGARGQFKDAIPLYEELLRRDPKNAQVLNNLAWALHGTKDARALEMAQRAFLLRPDSPYVLDTYGWALITSGKLHEGIQMLLKAVSLDEKNLDIRYHLAQALVQAGDKARARKELAAILAAEGGFGRAAEAKALLASLGP